MFSSPHHRLPAAWLWRKPTCQTQLGCKFQDLPVLWSREPASRVVHKIPHVTPGATSSLRGNSAGQTHKMISCFLFGKPHSSKIKCNNSSIERAAQTTLRDSMESPLSNSCQLRLVERLDNKRFFCCGWIWTPTGNRNKRSTFEIPKRENPYHGMCPISRLHAPKQMACC